MAETQVVDFSQLAGEFENKEQRPSSPLEHSHHRQSQDNTMQESLMTPMEKEQEHLLNPIDRGAPGDAALMAMVKRAPEEVLQSKRKSQFYGEVFAFRESNTSARDKVSRDSMVIVEMKTNVIIQDEFHFMTSLSNFLALRYQRPQSCILVSLNHSACLTLGGSFDPAYYMTVTALPSLIQSTLNKRNAALIQSFITEELNVAASRGVVKFECVPEENLATNGCTASAEIDNMDSKPGPLGVLGRRATGRRRNTTNTKENLNIMTSIRADEATDSQLPPTPTLRISPKSAKGPKSPKPNRPSRDSKAPKVPNADYNELRETTSKGSSIGSESGAPLVAGSEHQVPSRTRSKSHATLKERVAGAPDAIPDRPDMNSLPNIDPNSLPMPLSPADVRAEKMSKQKVGKRRSFLQMFGRRESASN